MTEPREAVRRSGRHRPARRSTTQPRCEHRGFGDECQTESGARRGTPLRGAGRETLEHALAVFRTDSGTGVVDQDQHVAVGSGDLDGRQSVAMCHRVLEEVAKEATEARFVRGDEDVRGSGENRRIVSDFAEYLS